jgi:hypothetical protein
MARSRPNEYPPLTAQRNPSRCREGLFFVAGAIRRRSMSYGGQAGLLRLLRVFRAELRP